ncbi:Copper chaperone SCO1/SenC [Methylophilaceae bacterium]
MLGGTGAAVAASAAVAILGVKPTTPSNLKVARSTRGLGYFPNIELTNHLGQKVKFYDDLIKDKFVVINMMYAQCSEGVCPISTYNLKRVHEALGDRVGRDIHMYSITLAADFDTPKVLKKYAEDNKTGAGWQFLTGNYADIEIIRRKLGFYDLDPVVDANRSQHAGVIRVFNEKYDRWMMAPALGKHENILQTIHHADRTPMKASVKA